MLRGFTPAERRAGRFLRDGEGHPPAPPAPPADTPPAPPSDTPPADTPPADTPPADDLPDILGNGDTPPADTPPADEPPALPEKYELTAPEGLTLDEATLAEADPIFRELGLNNDQAQKLVPVAAAFGQRIAEQAAQAANQTILSEVVEQRKAWAQEAQNDPEIGGTNWDQTLHLSAKALDAMGYPKGSPFRSFLTDSGLSNHPEMIRAMRRVGELVGEDGDFVVGNPAHQQKLPREAVLYPNDVPKGA